MKIGRLLLIICILLTLLVFNAYSQSIILGSKLMGTEVQPFYAPFGEHINSFTVAQIGEYAVLTAWATDGSSGEIFRTKLRGMEVDGFTPALGLIDQFIIAGPDGNGYVHLIAHSSSGESDTIFRSKLVGTGVKEFTAPGGQYINAIYDSSDANGYVYLVVSTILGIFEVTEFQAIPKRNYVLLKWRTETEQGSYQWLVQRKEKEGDYVTVGTVEGQGNVSQPVEYRFEDKGVLFGGGYFYRLEKLDLGGNSSYFGPLFVDLSKSDFIPKKMFVAQNFPNPFDRMTTIKFGIPLKNKDDYARLVVYDVTGRLIRTLISGKLEPGRYSIAWDGKGENARDAMSGVYFYRLSVADKQTTKKMLLIK